MFDDTSSAYLSAHSVSGNSSSGSSLKRDHSPSPSSNKRPRGNAPGDAAAGDNRPGTPARQLSSEPAAVTTPRAPSGNNCPPARPVSPTPKRNIDTQVMGQNQGCPAFPTPMRVSSSNVDSRSSNPNESSSLQSRLLKVSGQSQQSSESRDSNKASQVNLETMSILLRHEIRGRVFLYEKFFEDFLHLSDSDRSAVLEQMSPVECYRKDENDQWIFPPWEHKKEVDMYLPMVEILNVIGRAAHIVRRRTDFSDTLRSQYRPFIDHHAKIMRSDYPSDTSTSPDIVKAETDIHGKAHWGDVELVLECKRDPRQSDQNEALLQLVRYIRAVYAHQMYRLHVFGITVCGSVVQFVRFDRSAILHSPNVDLSTPHGRGRFVDAIMALLTLQAEEFGYDPRYSFVAGPDNTNLTLFQFEGHQARVVRNILCQRKCCCGRSTLVCSLDPLSSTPDLDNLAEGNNLKSNARDGSRPVSTSPKVGGNQDAEYKATATQFDSQFIVHRGIWREEDRPDECVTLRRYFNVFGVGQLIEGEHSRYKTAVKFPNAIKPSPAASYFSPAEAGHLSDPVWKPRVKSDMIVPLGDSIYTATSPAHILEICHDVILGIMAFAECGDLHCDISADNILVVDAETHYTGENKWQGVPKGSLGPAVWQRTRAGAREPPPANPSGAAVSNECPRLKYIQSLGRGPRAVVHDTEYLTQEHRAAKMVHTDRTGTPSFVSAQLLRGTMVGQDRVVRTFLHDIESVFWVLVWVVAHRSQNRKTWEVNEHASAMIRNLSQHNLKELAETKVGIISDNTLEAKIKSFNNDWSEELAPVILELADRLQSYMYILAPSSESRVSPARLALFEQHQRYEDEHREATFKEFLQILAPRI